jgi:putative toxin-antitoxin system antitoxin component (TIGR02293 family)
LSDIMKTNVWRREMGSRDVAAVLGGRKVLGKKVHGAMDLARLIETGFPEPVLERVKNALGLTDRETAKVLRVSEKTIGRLRGAPSRRLSPAASDRLYRIARLFALAEEVLERADAARDWLREPQAGLGNRSPLELMGTEAGSREVEDLLLRIEHSVLS